MRAVLASLALAAGCADSAAPLVESRPDLGATALDAAPKGAILTWLGPLELDFGRVLIGTQGELRARVRNDGDLPLDGETDVEVGLPRSAGAAFSVRIHFALRPGGEGEVIFYFRPKVAGAHAGTLEVAGHLISLKGEGVDAPTIIRGATDHGFGAVRLKTTQVWRFELPNPYPDKRAAVMLLGASRMTEPKALVLKTALLDGPAIIEPGESIQGRVHFSPQTVTSTAMLFTLSLSASEEEERLYPIGVDGVGTSGGIVCDPLVFLPTAIGTCREASLICRNPLPEPVTVLGFQADEDDSWRWPQLESPVELSIAERRSWPVQFCPTRLGAHGRGLSLRTPGAQHRASLRGVGVGARIGEVPTRIDLGEISPFDRARTALMVENHGLLPLRLSPRLSGANVSVERALEIPPGESRALKIDLFAERALEVNASLQLLSNDERGLAPVIHLTGRATELPTCDVVVTPSVLRFGQVAPGDERSRSVWLENRGAACLSYRPVFEGEPGAFRIMGAGGAGTIRLAHGERRRVTVIFSPVAQGSAQTLIRLDTPGTQLRLVVSGHTTVGPKSEPTTLDWARVSPSCAPSSRMLEIIGDPAIASVRVDPPDVGLTVEAEKAIRVIFDPARAPAFVEADLLIETESSSSLVPISARVSSEPIEEHFQVDRTLHDVLVVIDHSVSTRDEVEALVPNLRAYFQFTGYQRPQYHLAFLSTDLDAERPRGGFVPLGPRGRFLQDGDGASLDTMDRLASRLQKSPASGLERGMEAVLAALSEPALSGVNAGFLRDEASLSVIFISDEDDRSHVLGRELLGHLLALKGGERRRFSISAMAGDLPDGCEGRGGVAGPSFEQIELSQLSGGVFQSICTLDWSRSLEDLSTAGYVLIPWPLMQAALPQTIEVLFDGEPLPETSSGGVVNWRYDEEGQRLFFTPFAMPAPGQEFTIRYQPACP